MPEIVTIETPALGDRSYLIHDGAEAMVVDPQRDIDRVLAVAQARRVQITHVLETHIHNDYVTGGFALASRIGAEYVVAASEDVSFERLAVRDHDQITVGSLTMTVMHTPGHTPGHLSFALGEDGHDPVAVFTGGSMLYGAVGRTDLISPEQHRAADPGPVPLGPAPGRGAAGRGGRIPHPRLRQLLLRLADRRGGVHHRRRAAAPTWRWTEDEDAFVTATGGGLLAYPRYYPHMAPPTARSEPPDRVHPSRADPPGHRRPDRRRGVGHRPAGPGRVRAGSPDRHRLPRARRPVRHLRGVDHPLGRPAHAAGDHPDQVPEAQLQLTRIGIDRIAATATGPAEELASGGTVSSYPVTDFGTLAANGTGPAWWS